MKEEAKDALVQFSGIIMDKVKRSANTDMVLIALDFAHLLDSIGKIRHQLTTLLRNHPRWRS